jgi:hypothetical protein
MVLGIGHTATEGIVRIGYRELGTSDNDYTLTFIKYGRKEARID